jgi:hypothetical protein
MFFPPGSGSAICMRIRIRIQQLKLMRIHADPDTDPDPKPCKNRFHIGYLLPSNVPYKTAEHPSKS